MIAILRCEDEPDAACRHPAGFYVDAARELGAGLRIERAWRAAAREGVHDGGQLRDRAGPLTVQAFLNYVSKGFYNGLIFHRVVAGFVAQTGGYTPDFKLKPTTGTVFNESGNGLSNLRGTVGMARANEPHSGTSQFYINLADNVDLNPRPTRWGYAVFGKVVEGMEVVDDIGHRPTGGGGPFDRNVPVESVVVEAIQILQ
jgi:cyclophilin family peptidyl-prolyl cis-trans isomerase